MVPTFPVSRRLAVLVLWLAAGTALSQAPTATERDQASRLAIEQLLQHQVAAWNEGNLERFMSAYWKSGELTFSAGGEVTRGWQATWDRYRQRYPDRSAMGQLAFDHLEIRLLAPQAALVLGDWRLQRPTGPARGNFSLVLQQQAGRWVIVHDHTSVLEEGMGIDDETRD